MLTEIIEGLTSILYKFSMGIKGISTWFADSSLLIKGFIILLILTIGWFIVAVSRETEPEKYNEERYIHNRKF